ncbi:MAG: tetratricopeptide repeat protein [Bacteroidia bacterium]|nr:tetratricopeptide repeat protein [Bacteroidia bacterium]
MTRTLLLFLFFVSITLHLLSQSSKRDSLKKELKLATHDTIRCKILSALIDSEFDVKIWPVYNAELESICSDNLKKLKEGDPLYIFYMGNLSSAYANFGYLKKQQGNIPDALSYALKGLKLQEKLNDKKGKAATLNNIGFIYKSQEKPAKALEYFNQCLAIQEEIKDKAGTASSFNNIGYIYHYQAVQEKNINAKQTLFEKAMTFHKKSLNVQEEIGNKRGIALSYYNIGYIFLDRTDSITASGYFNKSLQLYTELGDRRGTEQTLSVIGALQSEKGQNELARKNVEKALQIAREDGIAQGIVTASKTLAKIYSRSGNWKDAYRMEVLYKQMSDSIANEKNQKDLFQKSYQYAYDKKVTADSIRISSEKKMSELKLQKELAIKNNLIIIIISAILTLVVFGVLLVFLLRSNRERKKAYQKLQQQTELLVKQSRQIAKYQSQMNPHFIFNALNSIQGFVVNNEKEKTLQQLQAFSKLMRQTLSNSDCETISLQTEIIYLQLYVIFEKERFTNKFDFVIECYADRNEIELPPMLIQPFVENALKHAGLNDVVAPVVKLSIRANADLLEICIYDNGNGITKSKSEIIQNSHAISIVKSRIKLLFENEGRNYEENYFSLRSVPEIESGTEVIIKLPLISKY